MLQEPYRPRLVERVATDLQQLIAALLNCLPKLLTIQVLAMA